MKFHLLEAPRKSSNAQALTNLAAECVGEEEVPPCGSIFNCSQRQLMALTIQCITALTISIAMSLYPPYYPELAVAKGLDSGMYGFVLGSNCLTAFIVTPVIAKYLDTIGHRFAYIVGIFVNSVCSILAGFLVDVPSGVPFVTLSVAIRVINAIGNAGVITSSFSFIAYDFPTLVSSMFAVTRLMSNLGQTAGPSLGGALFKIGGFKLPFVVLGGIQCVVGVFSIIFLPRMEESVKKEEKSGLIQYSRILRNAHMWIPISVFIVTTLANGFISVTLKMYILIPFALDPFYSGLMFGIKDAASCLSAPIWGWICERRALVRPSIIFCCSLVAFVYFFLAPFPGVTINLTLWLLCVLLVFNGFAINGLQVSSVIDALHEVIAQGYPDNPTTYGCVAGMWSAFSGLGRFSSRTASGLMVEHIGFQYSATVVCAFQILVIIIIFAISAIRRPEVIDTTPIWYKIQDEKPTRTSSDYANKIMNSCEFQRSCSFVEAL